MATTINETDVGSDWSVQGGRTYSIDFRIDVDPADDPIGAKQARDALVSQLGLIVGSKYKYPVTGTPIETDDFAYLQGIRVTRLTRDCRQWSASLRWDPNDPAQALDQKGPIDPETGDRLPFLAPPVVRWSRENEEIALLYDRAGVPIRNKANDPFDPPLTIPLYYSVVEVTMNRREFDPDWVLNFVGRLNDGTWMGWASESVLCQDISANRSWNADIQGVLWEVTYRFAIKVPITIERPSAGTSKIRPGWSMIVMNTGKRTLSGTGVPRRIIQDGVPASEPWPLDVNGINQLPSNQEPNFISFDVYPKVDFAGLDLPDDLFSAGTPEPPSP